MITSAQIRQRYVDFFAARRHRRVPSAPLVPPDDPTLLFTTAGMVQFKAYYSGAVPLPFTRAVTVQKCLRAGGKGSDLEQVGRTLRHHTFFEMLGNFSFGDYFKKEAIEWGWEFCAGKEWLGLPPERIWATVYGKADGQGGWIVDDEAERFWVEGTGIVNPITRLDEKENFWGPAGGTGACGPCSEIKFFMGTDEELKEYQQIARSGERGLEKIRRDIVEKGDLFLEIWNLVFPQYDQQPDGARPPLKNRGIDTGAGLERVTTACQFSESGGKIWSPYETDLMRPIIAKLSEIVGLPYPRLRGGEEAEKELWGRGLDPAVIRLAMNACADHARALTFALAEGIVPSNEGRGYVIRRILRRAARFGTKLFRSAPEPFLHKLVEPVLAVMGEHYPELSRFPDVVKKQIDSEESRFCATLETGNYWIGKMLVDRKAGERVTAEEAFFLQDTVGYPMDLVIETAEERGLIVDVEGFERLSADAKKRARATWKGNAAVALPKMEGVGATEFVRDIGSRITGKILLIVRGDQAVDSLGEGQAGIVALDRTTFYAESGGQIGDQGVFRDNEGAEIFRVEDTRKTDDGRILHFGEAVNRLSVGQEVEPKIHFPRRWATMKNHSVTHLLQGALKRLIGAHVTQSGSYVGPEHLRFDFTNPEALSDEKLREIELMVNEQVQRNLAVETRVLPIEEARKIPGIIAPFGEKYGAEVRVVKMGDFSTEFCGGTHLKSTGEIGPFIITSESSVASGIRRIEAKTGTSAAAAIAQDRAVLSKLARQLAVPPEKIEERVAALQAEVKTLKRSMEKAKTQQAAGKSAEMKIEKIGDVSVGAAWIAGAGVEELRSALDSLKGKHQSRFLALLGSDGSGNPIVVAAASQDLAGSPYEAGKAIRAVAHLFDGKGGGKPQFAQAGCKDAEKLKRCLENGSILEQIRKLEATAKTEGAR